MTGRRVDGYGLIDRSRPKSLTFDAEPIEAFAGDTVASALLAAGTRIVGHSVRLGRPRGIVSAGVEEPTGLIQVTRPYDEPMLAASVVEVMDGMAVESLGGQGRLNAQPDHATYDAMNAHCEVLIVGAGPAGLTAAHEAMASGQQLMLIDDRPEPGGALLQPHELDWAQELTEALDAAPNVQRLSRATVTGYYDDNYLIAIQRRRDHDDHGLPEVASRERVWRIRARQVILATGALERPIAFAGNDAPGVMLASSVRRYLHRYGVLCGEQVVIFAADDDAYPTAAELHAAGARVIVIDPRVDGARVVGTTTDENGVLVGVIVTDQDGSRTLPADLLAVSGGWNPTVHLYSHGGGRLAFDDAIGAFVPDLSQPPLRKQRVTVIGAAAGDMSSPLPESAEPRPQPAEGQPAPGPPSQPIYLSTETEPRELTDAFVDLQRDVSVAELVRASGTGMTSIEHVKRYTTAGTAHDQGKTSGTLTTAVVAQLLGLDPSEMGTTTFRPPYTAIKFATLAGRERGDLYEPIRTTLVHPWHIARGAVFENVGQWKRPLFYPRPGEDLHTAVLRECAAVRTNVGFLDGSTLGKIDVQGADAGRFLDLIYTNLISSLKVGMIRYGVMCGPDGMIIDDGTAIRLADDRYLITTTTGNAAKILDWLEEWHQTEWADLNVAFTSVTEQWATIALAGPNSRALLADLAPVLDVGAEAFPFMAWRDTTVAGLPARVCRISFSGELAYEINVAWSDAPALWDAVWALGEPRGLTPYGTETMHVLRAEKGYPIIGQDTDGTITPQDLGMSWVVSKKKIDFLGKRSFTRAENQREDRKHLVALLPDDHRLGLPEGAQLVEYAELPAPGPDVRVPMLGHVTSAYRSAALDRTFGLALVKGGRRRIGDRIHAVVDGIPRPVTVASPVLVDPDGARRDGDPDAAEAQQGSGGEVLAPGAPVSPLQAFTDALLHASGLGVTITERPHRTMINLQSTLDSAPMQAAGGVLRCAVPEQTNLITSGDRTELAALGPTEVLLLAEPARAAELEAALRDAAPGLAVCDVSAVRTTIEVSGPRTRELLSQGCAIDLAALVPGRCAQTLLAQCAVLLVADGRPGESEDRVRILVRSSFATHLARWLIASAAELND